MLSFAFVHTVIHYTRHTAASKHGNPWAANSLPLSALSRFQIQPNFTSCCLQSEIGNTCTVHLVHVRCGHLKRYVEQLLCDTITQQGLATLDRPAPISKHDTEATSKIVDCRESRVAIVSKGGVELSRECSKICLLLCCIMSGLWNDILLCQFSNSALSSWRKQFIKGPWASGARLTGQDFNV